MSHTVVDLRPFRYLPIFTQSSFLLNISETGALLEFVADPKIKQGNIYWMIAHLTPLGITSLHALHCHLECRWVDTKSCKMGGSFVNLGNKELKTIDLIIKHIREKSAPS